MTKKLMILIGILISLNSCNQTEAEKIKESDENKIQAFKKEKKEVTELNPVMDLYIVNDSLTIVLESELDKIALNKKFKIDKKAIQNRHVENIVDTIVTRTFENTILTSYKATSEEWIYEAKIENSEFELNDFIKIGTKKYAVEKSVAKRISTDVLTIGNLEQTSKFTLRFESGILKTIEYYGYID